MTSSTPLPGLDSVGKSGTWTIADQHGQTITITGELLGLGSSYRPRHQNHPDTEFAPPRTHCSTCRWTEIRIFAVDSEEGNPGPLPYLVVKRGASAIPGEKDFVEWEGLVTGDEVLEKLTTRRGTDAFLTAPASRAASQAAAFDPGVRDAWQNRAVK
ncbi:hypothetical protein [Streptomyces sp. NRRL S-455]|uniref:hypothetical protein n=1 Tax=Streptomyces sp. NRRL S-455 TaxID=1463908 RepID=UPI0004C26F98|nr:hypothetical protein [Streptomyces sp. NRRL S-455]